MNDRLPVLVGVGQVRGNRGRIVGEAREPLALICEALDLAAADAGAPALLAAADAIYTVRVASWAYDELSREVATAVDASPAHRVDSPIGGQWPIRLLDEAAARIASGESTVALLVGGEATASASALRKTAVDPVRDLGWSARPGGPSPIDAADLGSPAMQAAGLMLPTRVYPLYENRLQADLGLTPAENADWSARLYADLSAVAATNPIAWNTTARSADDVGTVTPENRMVCEPYPLSMNALPFVDQAAAVIVTSLGAARAAGVRPERIVHVHAAAGVDDLADVVARPKLGRSTALADALTTALSRASAPAMDFVDVYTCFPIVAKLAGLALGLPREAVLSITGGHSSFGGPLNSYSLHALARAVERLRGGDRFGLVHANGGFLTKQHAVVLGSAPASEYVTGPVQVRDGALPVVYADQLTDGPMLIETVTVEHGRTGTPTQAFAIVSTADGARAAVCTPPGDEAAASAWSLDGCLTHVGRPAVLRDGVLRPA
ncbi:acetyl-CoA acetyltransferase [Cryptosporangium phraense]|uniref:Acetyl-CoA acetyltransferase n=1 Tax=Cryptosporangium phraense TaxID=2593070 RepID=A0A545AM56_9ACTN|nr:acetyl-CoA acetyltransferase [Cryptosporangium phraense]TQS42404.1 acetyl-CoA acetyltransferase [Cryptosporangium phraense]